MPFKKLNLGQGHLGDEWNGLISKDVIVFSNPTSELEKPKLRN